MDVKEKVSALTGNVNHSEWDFEKSLDSNEVADWLSRNFTLGLGCALFYLGAVFAGKKYMENQPRYNLRQPMMIWSLLLAVFSIFGSIRSMIVMYNILKRGGFRAVICDPQFYLGPITRFWGPVFVFSKILEYMDTVFIILRKQKLIFLHWYHHLTVSLFSWWCYGSQFAGGGVFMTVNFIVHAFMYSYYAVRAAGIRVPKPIAVVITSSQIIQMVIGCATMYASNLWRNDGDCKSSFEHILYGSIMYGSYLILFVHFFYSAYLKAHPPRDLKPSSDSKQSKKEIKQEESQQHNLIQAGWSTGDGYNLRERKRND